MTAAHAAEFEVAVDDFFFAPEEIFVNVGDTVTWTWVGEAPHDVTPVEEGAFEPSPLQTEGQFSVTFDQEGEVPYFCTIHASPDGSDGMIGTVNVLPAGEPLPEPRPEPRPAPEPGRLPPAGDTVDVALTWSSLFADGSAPTVALGRDDLFADSLTSGSVQGLVDGPLLLTPSGSLDDRVAAELDRLGTATVVVMGGSVAIGPAVEQQLIDLGYTVERVEGPTRTETALAVAETFFADATEAFMVRSHDGGADPTQAFADSLAVGGAAARQLVPVLLSTTEGLTETTSAYLQVSDIQTVHMVGGEAALSPQVVADLEALGIAVERFSGPDRFATALEIAFVFYDDPPVALLTEGQAPDAWASGFAAASAAESAPILLANGDGLPQPSVHWFSLGVAPLCGPNVSPAACEMAEIASTAVQFGEEGLLLAAMNGVNEVPDTGHPTAVADFLVGGTDSGDALCYEIATYGLDEPVTGAHIHDGAEGEAGDIVVPLEAPGDRPFLRTCAFDLDPVLVADILVNPAAYYVNYHTETYPAGAVRGQLFEAETIGLAELSPQNEVPPVDANAAGFAAVFTDAADHSRLAYLLTAFADGEELVAAHIHQAPEGENGPVVHPLQLGPEDQDGGRAGTFLDEGVDPALVESLLADPSAFYVNVHSDVHPDGVVRGQLFNPFGG